MLVTRQAAGPFGIMDAIGLNVIMDAASGGGLESEEFALKQAADYLRPYIERGDLGMKTGKGFYSYPDPAYQQPEFLSGDDS